MSLGPHIKIERQLNDRDYYCRCTIDNTIFPVHVDPEYRDEIADEFADEDPVSSPPKKKPCVFLRKNRHGEGTCCAIYTTRPNVCRDFRCYRLLIRNRNGVICGKVIGKNTLRADDATLDNLWNEQVIIIPYGDDIAWTKQVARILAAHGYLAEVAE
jgi:Fe-S-cluster containining protein